MKIKKNIEKILMAWIITIVALFIILIANVNAEEGAPPENGGESFEDWIIENGDDIVREDQEIFLTGNLTIEDNAKLTFENVTLKMNCSKDGEYKIKVKYGGEFNIYDKDEDQETEKDSSNITKTDRPYLFFIEDGAKMEMKYSKLNGCGYDDENPGLKTESDDVLILESNISNNYCGIYCDSKSPRIFDSKISNNTYGIYFYFSKLKTEEHNISENIISDNYGGIYCEGSDPWIIENQIENNDVGISCNEDSNPTIINNDIKNNLNGITSDSSKPIIEVNTISNNGNAVILRKSNVTIIESKIQNNDNALICFTSSPELINCTISNTQNLDITSNDDSHPLLTSLTGFNRDAVVFGDSNSDLTVKWFLDVKVINKEGNPVNKANVRVQDNDNGDFDENHTTKSDGWASWIVVTEYILKNTGEVEYTPHTINASKNEVYDELIKKIDNNKKINFEINLVIDNDEPIISNIKAKDIKENSATITWETDELSDSYIEYGKTSSFSSKIYNPTQTMYHEINLTGLEKNKTYYFKVSSKDDSDNNATSEKQEFKTQEGEDTDAPEITDIDIEKITRDSVTITWKTNEKSTSQVEYGVTDSYGKVTTRDNELLTSHKVILIGLESNKKYHFRVISEDKNGNEEISRDETFKTVESLDIVVEIEAEEYTTERKKEQIITALITNNEDVDITIDINIMVGDEELYNNKNVIVDSGKTEKIQINWTANTTGTYTIRVIVEIDGEEVGKEEIHIIVEKEDDGDGGTCIMAYVFPLVVICCMIVRIRKKGM